MTARAAALILASAFAGGCAGARIEVTAASSKYPLSMSDHVRDRAGTLHGRHSLEKVGELSAKGTRLGFLYSGLTPFSTYDISEEVNQQVSAARGEAVIDIAVTVPIDCVALNEFPIVGILPIWPGCVSVQVTGDIVRRRPAAPAVAPAAASAPTTPPP